MLGYRQHEESEEHQGGAIVHRTPYSPLRVHTSAGRANKTDDATTSQSSQVKLGRQMREKIQATEGFSNISIGHTKAET